MKKVKVKIKKAAVEIPEMAYGGQIGFALDIVPDSYLGGYQELNDEHLRKTLQPVDRRAANVEAEKGEAVVGDFNQDGVPEQFSIGGKKHSRGGTPLNVPDGSFIYSDTKKLKMKGAEVTPFGKSAKNKKGYTPAELAKQYDVNKYQAIIDNPDSDPLSVKTAQMMMSNYQKKLAELALVQEAKKGFPNGIPEIAIPLFVIPEESIANAEDQPQMKFGGSLPKAAEGLSFDPFDPWKGSRHNKGVDKSKYSKEELEKLAKDLGYTGPQDNLALQRWIMANPEMRKVADNLHKQYGMPLAGRMDDGKWGYRWDAILDEIRNQRNNVLPEAQVYARKPPKLQLTEPNLSFNSPAEEIPFIPNPNFKPAGQQPATSQDGVTPNDFNAVSNAGNTNYDYLTPDKLTVMQGLRNRAGIKRYGPWEAPVEGYLPDPTFYDPSRELASNAEQMNTQMMYNNQFSGPQSVAARNSQVAGQAASNAADILSRYNTMNVNTANQFSGARADVMNRLQEAQGARATRLYQGNVVANQQYDNAVMQAENELTKSAINAWNNRTMLGMTNDVNPYYSVDPVSGRITFKGGRSLTSSTPGSSAPAATYKDWYNQGIAQGMDPDTAKKWALDMFQGNKATYSDKNNDGIMDAAKVAGMYTGVIGPGR